MIEDSKNKNYVVLQDKYVFVGLPIISNKTRKDMVNNEEFTVIDISPKKITIKNDRITLDIKHKIFKYFDLAYCITIHKAQGCTYDQPYSIYERELFDKQLLYTAMSRATERKYINFCSIDSEGKTGYVYKITDNNGKVYIGSTKTSLHQRFNEHKLSDDGSPLHVAIKDPSLTFTISLVEAVEYRDEQELLLKEAMYITEYNAIARGYNTKSSVDWTEIF